MKIHRNIPLLFIIRICRAATTNFVWTVWPLYVMSLGANIYETTIVWAVSGLLPIFLRIPLAAFTDRFGRKPAMLLSLVFIIIPNFAYTQVSSWEMLIPFKMLSSLGALFFTPAQSAMIADISIPENRGKMYSIVNVAHPIGSIPSPLIGAYILDSYGWDAVFYAIIAAAAIAIIPSLFLSETAPSKTRKTKEEVEIPTNPSKSFLAKLDREFLIPILIFFFIQFFNMNPSQITPIYLDERFNVSTVQQGLFFSLGTMVVQLIVRLPGGWLADRYRRQKLMLITALINPVTMLLWPYMNSYESLLMLQMINTSTRISMSAQSALLMDFTDEARRGIAVGISGLGRSVGNTLIGTSLIGYLYNEYGFMIPFYALAILLIPRIPLIMLLEKRERKTDYFIQKIKDESLSIND